MAQVQRYQVAATFGVPAPSHLEIEGYADETHPLVPRTSAYIFRQGLSSVLAFLQNANDDALMITGPTGSGKTSLVEQIAARLNWPVQDVTCHGRLEFQDLVGAFQLVLGDTQFVHGPLAVAAREGHILLLNEVDHMDPAELTGLNGILEGSPLVIAANGGEVIKPHPKFRIVVTGNSAGSGDSTGLYAGVMRQNLAFMDRFRVMKVDYPDEDIELKILGELVPALPNELATKMIAVANEVRRLFVGSATGSELNVTLSTRTLLRWGHLAIVKRASPNALQFALEEALTNRCDDRAERDAIHRIAADVFGQYWNNATGQPMANAA